jgi:hypothetical protein
MQSDSSGRFGSRPPASPLHNYQRRPPQGTASKRIRHIRVIPETAVLRSGASSIKSNHSSRASSVDGRREDSDYDRPNGPRTDLEGFRDGQQIQRKGSPLSGRPKRVTLKPKAVLRDVFQGKDDEWEDEDEFVGGYGQCKGVSTGDRWVNGYRAASFPTNTVDEQKKQKRKGDEAEEKPVLSRRGIPVAKGAPMTITEEEEEE